MDVEIVFTGLCSFLNLSDTNRTMPEPSVILIKADHDVADHEPDEELGEGSNDGRPAVTAGAAPGGLSKACNAHTAATKQSHGHSSSVEAETDLEDEDLHIPFIAYNKKTTKLDNDTGFSSVSDAPDFRYMELAGVLIAIDADIAGKPTIDGSYKQVLRKDDYWPEADNQWNRDFVPFRGGKPKKSAVAAFMRLGGGTVGAGRVSGNKLRFAKHDGSEHIGTFAEEVTYTLPRRDRIVLTLSDLETGVPVRRLEFSALDSSAARFSIFIGNNTEDDMDEALNREVTTEPVDPSHVAFLNRVADPHVPYPAPKAEPFPPKTSSEDPAHGDQSGGGNSGYCGPGNANGE